jgi:hypothetical protein
MTIVVFWQKFRVSGCVFGQLSVDLTRVAYYQTEINREGGLFLFSENVMVVCLVSGGPLDIMNRSILCGSSKELADQISKDIVPIEFERD